MKRERKLDRKWAELLPPNMDAKQVHTWILGLLILLVLVCSIVFLCVYCPDRRELYRLVSDGMIDRWVLREDAMIPNFGLYLMPTVYITAAAAGLSLLLAAVLYSAYYQGSRSIYLMRRLPDGGRLLRRQVWSVPLLAAALALALGAVMVLLTWLVWRFATPRECLPTPENLQRVMQAIFNSPYSQHLP